VALSFILVLIALGTFVGVLSSLLGIGGGLLMVPFLTGLGFGVLPATATSLVGVVFSSVSGSVRNWWVGELDWRRSLGLAIGGIPAAQLGALAGERLSASGLAFSFAALQVFSIYLVGLRQRLARDEAAIEVTRAGAINSGKSNFGESDSGPNDSEGRGSAARWFDAPAIGIGAIAGALAGLFGVGGGVVMVPLQMLVLKTPIKEAVRVGLGAIVAIGLSGLARHALQGNVLWIPGLCLGAGGVVGAQFGARMLPRLSPSIVTWMFRALLAIVAALMIVEGWLALP